MNTLLKHNKLKPEDFILSSSANGKNYSSKLTNKRTNNEIIDFHFDIAMLDNNRKPTKRFLAYRTSNGYIPLLDLDSCPQ